MPKALFKNDDEKFAFVQRCRMSGMTDKDFCACEGISETALYRYIRHLKAKSYDVPKNPRSEKHEIVLISDGSSESCACDVPNLQKPATAPLDQEGEQKARIHISVGRFHIDVDGGADASMLRDTLMILQRIC